MQQPEADIKSLSIITNTHNQGELCISSLSSHPTLLPLLRQAQDDEGEGVSSFPPLEERIEVRRELNLFRVMQRSF